LPQDTIAHDRDVIQEVNLGRRIAFINARQLRAKGEALNLAHATITEAQKALGEKDVQIRLFGNVQGGYSTLTSDFDMILLRSAPEGISDIRLQTTDSRKPFYGYDKTSTACAKMTAR